MLNHDISHSDAQAATSGRTLEALVETIVSELERTNMAPPMEFEFKWRGHPVMARVDAAPSGIRLVIDTVIGNVPFTAENKKHRELLLRMARENNGINAPKLAIDRCAFGLSMETAWTGPATAGKILGHVVEMLCLSASYAASIEELCAPARA